MAGRGPVPKPAGQRRNRAKLAVEASSVLAAGDVVQPPADPGWHSTASALYQSLADSPQVELFQPSDWATAFLVCDSVSREFAPRPVRVGRGDDAETVLMSLPISAAAMNAWRLQLAGLLATEGDRRKVRVSVDRPLSSRRGKTAQQYHDELEWLDDARRRLHGGGD